MQTPVIQSVVGLFAQGIPTRLGNSWSEPIGFAGLSMENDPILASKKLFELQGFIQPSESFEIDFYTALTAAFGAASGMGASAEINCSVLGENELLLIGPIAYTLVAVPAEPYDVKWNANPSILAANLTLAIAAAGRPNNEYGENTVAHPDLTPGNVGDYVTLTLNAVGYAGNSYNIVTGSVVGSISEFLGGYDNSSVSPSVTIGLDYEGVATAAGFIDAVMFYYTPIPVRHSFPDATAITTTATDSSDVMQYATNAYAGYVPFDGFNTSKIVITTDVAGNGLNFKIVLAVNQ